MYVRGLLGVLRSVDRALGVGDGGGGGGGWLELWLQLRSGCLGKGIGATLVLCRAKIVTVGQRMLGRCAQTGTFVYR